MRMSAYQIAAIPIATSAVLCLIRAAIAVYSIGRAEFGTSAPRTISLLDLFRLHDAQARRLRRLWLSYLLAGVILSIAGGLLTSLAR
jgi:hypothetical protein